MFYFGFFSVFLCEQGVGKFAITRMSSVTILTTIAIMTAVSSAWDTPSPYTQTCINLSGNSRLKTVQKITYARKSRKTMTSDSGSKGILLSEYHDLLKVGIQ